MGSIRHWPRPQREGPKPAEDFVALREAFQAQIQSERVRLVALSAALARSEENPSRIFDDLVHRAHVLQDGAEMLEFSEIAAAANSLQQAAYCASLAHADNTDAQVWTALAALVNLMGTVRA